jgi:glucan phosphoethanolaminetransferase (alkaline phosphatase superfamily)
MSVAVNIIVSLVLFFFMYCFFPLRIYLKFKKAGVKGALKHNLRIVISYILLLFFSILSQTITASGIAGPNAAPLTGLPASACIVFAVYFTIKGMQAGNAAIKGTPPAVSGNQPLARDADPKDHR